MNLTSKHWIRLASLMGLLLAGESAYAGPSRCFLHGIITPLYENKDKTTLSDMIRMRFDADDRVKCELMITNYCQYNILEKAYSPKRLKGYFKPDVDKSEESAYTLAENCKLIPAEE